LSHSLRTSLSGKFRDIDVDCNGQIDLHEFLTFFLLNPNFKEEVLLCASSNAPWNNEFGLTFRQKMRLCVYKIIEEPSYSTFSKAFFCFDLILAFVPAVVTCSEGFSPNLEFHWYGNEYMWAVNGFFLLQYIIGLLTCKSTRSFVCDLWHVNDLLSFLPWFVFVWYKSPRLFNPAGFDLFRTVRFWKLYKVFNMSSMRNDVEIYAQTVNFIYSSYRSVVGIMLWLVLFFSMLIYVFERGTYDKETGIWIRESSEGNSPYSHMWNCIYFNIVTMTTLGYGDIFPKSHVGKFVALMSACVGICNLTFLINIVGGCFEETYKNFILSKNKKMDTELNQNIEKYIKQASEDLKRMQLKHARQTNHRLFGCIANAQSSEQQEILSSVKSELNSPDEQEDELEPKRKRRASASRSLRIEMKDSSRCVYREL